MNLVKLQYTKLMHRNCLHSYTLINERMSELINILKVTEGYLVAEPQLTHLIMV